MEYTQEELELMHAAEMGNSEDTFFGDPNSMKPVSFAELKFSDNAEVFNTLKGWLERGSLVSVSFGIEEGNPYYELNTQPNKKKLYLNKEILNYIYNWFEKNSLDAPIPKDYIGAKNATEQYLFHLMKRDRNNEKLFYVFNGLIQRFEK